MQIVISDKGATYGQINIKNTLLSMDINESWNTDSTHIHSLGYLRQAASGLLRTHGRRFSISTLNKGAFILVKRVA